jgi:hypothetical protein
MSPNPQMTIDDYLALLELHSEKLKGLVDSKMFESLLPEDVSQSYNFVELEIARITSLPNHDNIEDRRLIKKFESVLRSMLEDIEITKGLKGEETRVTRSLVQ